MKRMSLCAALAVCCISGRDCRADLICGGPSAPTSCSNCGFWPWNDLCDWTEVGTQSGVVYKQYTPTDCTGVCPLYNVTTCNFGFWYAIGSTRWTWSTGLDIPLAKYATFKAVYNSGTNSTTVTYQCNGTETINPGNCGTMHYNSLRWDYVQKAYKQRVYDWDSNNVGIGENIVCNTTYSNPHICTPCVGNLATGEEVSGCDSSMRTVFTVPAKATNACAF